MFLGVRQSLTLRATSYFNSASAPNVTRRQAITYSACFAPKLYLVLLILEKATLGAKGKEKFFYYSYPIDQKLVESMMLLCAKE
ncbi:hypothetical protein BHE74_00000942 [Ensete ventricosum]|nr:hypothetical protein GW17_00058572 [Ensete ventricosum]RWW89960.1 hypothetical protein BHE74_00000942 [Ensete ventricosum]